jgi:hypothetical protein
MGRRPMTALLLGLGALLLAVAAGALLGPRPSHTDRADDQMPSVDEIVSGNRQGSRQVADSRPSRRRSHKRRPSLGTGLV